MPRPLILAGLLVCLTAFLAGCSHYRLGTGATLAFKTLYVAPVANDAALPQAAALVTARVREAFLRDGRLTLAPGPGTADAVLTIALDTLEREVATVRPDDTGLARKVDLDLSATATLRDRRTGTVLFENRPLVARRQVFTDSGQIQAEYQTLTLLADALAAEAVRAVVDIW
jgi:hypothetical protein